MLNGIKTPTSSVEGRKTIFTTELLKSGVEAPKAVEVARILASELTDEQLTNEQIELVKTACARWLKERKRQNFVDGVIQQIPICQTRSNYSRS
jgi:hypothetical protein